MIAAADLQGRSGGRLVGEVLAERLIDLADRGVLPGPPERIG
ncbi:MAG: hypothetical protein ABMB14_29590 [Myxococcota bacterium]